MTTSEPIAYVVGVMDTKNQLNFRHWFHSKSDLEDFVNRYPDMFWPKSVEYLDQPYRIYPVYPYVDLNKEIKSNEVRS